MKINIYKFTPFIFLFALIGLLGWELYFSKPGEMPSMLLGKKIPTFALANLLPSQPALTEKDLQGRVTLLNVWASWCTACIAEHEMLMKISNVYHVPIYSIVYKDNTQNALRVLTERGNPYVLTGDDKEGDVVIDLGVYGTPETFVINAKGQIVFRVVGMLTQSVWDNTLYPLIIQLRKSCNTCAS